MILQLLNFELFYQRKQWAFLLFSLLFLLFGCLVGMQSFAPAKVNFNSVYQISFQTGIFTLGTLFIVVFFSVSGVLRDRRYTMEHMIFSTSIKKSEFFISRFAGVFFFTLLSFSTFLVGFAFGTLSPSLDPTRLSPFDLEVYIRTWLIFIVPNVFIVSAIVFSVSLLTKNNVATYVSGVALYMLYILGSMFLNSPVMAQSVPGTPESLMMASYLDPFGLSAFFEQTQFWTPYQKNNQMVALEGYLLINRLIWTIFSILTLVVTYYFFSFRTLSGKHKKIVTVQASKQKSQYRPTSVTINGTSKWLAFFRIWKAELRSVFISLPFLGAIGCWIVIVFTEIYSRLIEGGSYRDSWYPSSNLLIELFTEPLPAFCIILIVFYSGELVWRDRGFRMNEIIDSSPISNVVLFISKFATLISLPALFIFTAIIMALGFQVVSGYFIFEWDLYFSVFFYWGMDLLFYSVLVLFIQTMVPNKFLGMGVSALTILLLGSSLSTYIGIEHPLLRLGFIPIPGYTNMSGYSAGATAFNHFTLYWVSLAGILGVVAYKFWQRGISQSIRFRWQLFKISWANTHYLGMAALLLVFVISGAFVFYHTNIVDEYQSINERLNHKEAYERKFKKYGDLQRLNHVAMNSKVDLYPEKNQYQFEANYVLQNKSNSPVDQVFITERTELDSISIEGGELIESNEEFGIYLFQFSEPILPGQEVGFHYKFHKKNDGYKVDNGIPTNGSYLMYNQFEPKLGYSRGMEISDAYERSQRGLPEREIENADLHLAKDIKTGKVLFETVISTTADQTAIAPGKLIGQWEENGRNYFHYKPSGHVVPFIAYFSAAYKTKIGHHDGVAIEQYYHPGHEYNLEKIEESTKETLAYCIENFGPYPYDHIRIAEIPGHWGFGGAAHPGTISMVEDKLYLVDISDTTVFDLVAKRTIHEVAHQWFGGILSAKVQDGASMLIEGLAKYAEAVVMEKMYGKKSLWQISESANYKYFFGRAYASEPEPPIYLTDDQSYLNYGKNFTVMIALRELIGEKNVNHAIRTLVDRHGNENELKANALEFLDEIYKVSPTQYHELIDDWFKRVIIYDLQLSDASYVEQENGLFEITLNIKAQRNITDDGGSQSTIGINEPISIGLFKHHPNNLPNDQSIIYYEQNMIDNEETQIKVVVKELPTYVSIDPFGTRTDKNLYDNVKKLK